MDDARAAEGWARFQKEIQAEKAAALCRIAGTLEGLIQTLARLPPPPPGDAAAAERYRQRHDELRGQALRYRWYLEVQRESVGITRHEGLDETYPIPGPFTPAR